MTILIQRYLSLKSIEPFNPEKVGKTMKGLYFDKKLQLKIDIDKPKPNKGESLIKISLSSICNTDIEILKGYKNFTGVLGHEFVGIVEESENKDLIGKRVVGDINIGCSKCKFCKKGLKNHCMNRKILGMKDKNGSFQEYITLPNENIYIVPENVTDLEAVFTEPIAAALEILEMEHIKPRDKVVIIGDGKLTQLITQVISLTGCKLYIIGKYKDKLEFLKNKGTTILLDEIEDLNLWNKFDIAIDCTGNAEGLQMAQDLVKSRGTIILKSTYNSYANLNPTLWVVNEINVIGTRCGPMDAALRLLERKLISVEYLVSGIYSLEEYKKAFSKENKFKSIIDMKNGG